MHLTTVFRLRADSHDQALLRASLARWGAALGEAMDRARARQAELLHCIVHAKDKDGNLKFTKKEHRPILRVDGYQLRLRIRECCDPVESHLHSSADASLVIALEEQIKSWLGLYLDWMKRGRSDPKPGFPTVAPGTAVVWSRRWPLVLDEGRDRIMSLGEENDWRARVTRASHAKLTPHYFGAATSGMAGLAHCGLLKRADGRYFALLTLWGRDERRGEAITLASGRGDPGPLVNPRGTEAFQPTSRQRSSILVPLERGSGPGLRRKRWERKAFDRGTPKSAEVVCRDGEFFLHVAFDLPEREPRPLTGSVLAIRRGITTLLAAVVVDTNGQVLHRERIEGRDLVRTITAIQKVRALRQQKGQPTRGDRRAARVAEHVIFSAAHQIIHLACQYGAEVVLLADKQARKPTPFLAYKHFSNLHEVLGYLTRLAGLPEARERQLYGAFRTCPRCGWNPQNGTGAEVEETATNVCGGCGTAQEAEFHLAHLLALDTLRFRNRRAVPEGNPDQPESGGLGRFIRELRARG